MDSIHDVDSGEADVSTVNHAASKILSLMDGDLPKGDTHPPEDQTPEIQEPQESQEPQVQESQEATAEEPIAETEEELASYLSDVAEHLGVEEEYLYTLKVPTKVSGTEKEVTIKDLVATFQKGESADLKLMELADTRKQFESELSQTKDQIQQEWSRAQALNSELQGMLYGTDDAEIESLRYSDPGEYAARMAEKNARLQKAERVQKELIQANAEKAMNEYQRRVNTERTRLVEAIPLWADDKVRESETLKVRQYLKSEGLKDYEIDGKIENGQLLHAGLIDHRYVSMARKAMLYDEARKGTDPKKKRLKSLPKVGSGKPKSKGEAAQDKVSSIRAKAKETGSVTDAAEVIRQLMEK